jgi:hypothetical protein
MLKMRADALEVSVGRLLDRCLYTGDRVHAYTRAATLLRRMNRDGSRPHLASLATSLEFRAQVSTLTELIDEYSESFFQTQDPDTLDLLALLEDTCESCTLAYEQHQHRFYRLAPAPKFTAIARALRTRITRRAGSN